MEIYHVIIAGPSLGAPAPGPGRFAPILPPRGGSTPPCLLTDEVGGPLAGGASSSLFSLSTPPHAGKVPLLLVLLSRQ